MERNREAFERNREAIDRNTAVVERTRWPRCLDGSGPGEEPAPG
jgi:hypothetical protein